jgi:ribosome biogenesis SPOUT family RNA methylase Rps3
LLSYASKDLRNDRELVSEIIKKKYWELNLASVNLKNDRELILEAVKINGMALAFTSYNLQNDREIVLEAFKTKIRIMEDILENFNEKFIQFSQRMNGTGIIIYVSEHLKDDHEVILHAVKEDGRAIKYASENLKRDDVILFQANKSNTNVLKSAYRKLDDVNLEKFKKYDEKKYVEIYTKINPPEPIFRARLRSVIFRNV